MKIVPNWGQNQIFNGVDSGMTDFNSIFPNFVNQCVQLKQLLTPIAFLLLTGGLISSIVTGQKSGNAYMRVVARTLVLVVILTFLVSWEHNTHYINRGFNRKKCVES